MRQVEGIAVCCCGFLRQVNLRYNFHSEDVGEASALAKESRQRSREARAWRASILRVRLLYHCYTPNNFHHFSVAPATTVPRCPLVEAVGWVFPPFKNTPPSHPHTQPMALHYARRMSLPSKPSCPSSNSCSTRSLFSTPRPSSKTRPSEPSLLACVMQLV